jgi:uncharacterized membrane-anchored protein
MAILTIVLVLVIALAWKTRWTSQSGDPKAAVLRADAPYWFDMLLAGTLGTVMGDYFSHDLQLGDAVGAIVLTAILAAMFAVGSKGLIWSLPFYWATIVMVRAGGYGRRRLLCRPPHAGPAAKHSRDRACLCRVASVVDGSSDAACNRGR